MSLDRIRSSLLKARDLAETCVGFYTISTALGSTAVAMAREPELLDDAIQTAGLISKDYDASLALIEVADVRMKAGDQIGFDRIHEEVGRLVKRMQQGDPSDHHLLNNTIAHKARSLALAKQFTEARELGAKLSTDPFNSMESAMVLEAIAKRQVEDGRLDGALKTLRGIEHPFNEYQEICQMLLDQGKIDDALKVVRSTTDDFTREALQNQITVGLVESGQTDRAKSIVLALPKQDRPEALLGLLYAAADKGTNVLAQLPLDAIRRVAQKHKEHSLLAMLSVYEQLNRPDEKQAVIKDITQLMGTWTNQTRQARIRIELCVISNDLKQAARIADTLEPSNRDATWAEIADAYRKAGNEREATAIAARIESRYAVAEYYLNGALEAYHLGRKSEALKAFAESHARLADISGAMWHRPFRDGDPKLDALLKIIEHQIMLGDYAGAAESLETMHRDYGYRGSSHLIRKLTLALMQAGAYSSVDRILARFKDPEAQVYVFLGMADALSEARKADRPMPAARTDELIPPPKAMSDRVASGELNHIRRDLDRVWEEHREEPAHLLRHTSRVLQRACINLDWETVRKALEKQGFSVGQDRQHQHNRSNTVVLRKKGYTTSVGQQMALQVEFTMYVQTSRKAASRYLVTSVNSALSIEDLNVDHQVVAGEHWFGEGSMIDRVLNHSNTYNVAVSNRFVESVELEDRITRDWKFSEPRSFYLRMDLNDREKNPTHGQSLSSTIHMDDGKITFSDPFSGGSWSKDVEQMYLISPSHVYRGSARKTVKAYSVGDLKTLPENITSLDLDSDVFQDEDLAHLVRFNNLEELDLGECKRLTEHALPHLADLKKLESLTMMQVPMGRLATNYLATLPKLSYLCLYSAGPFSRADCEYLAASPSLRTLNVGWIKEIDDDMVGILCQLPQLEGLEMWGCDRISDKALKHLAARKSLKMLSISHSKTITTKGVQVLADLKHLEYLTLGYMPLDDGIFEAIAPLTGLKVLSLRGLNITDEGIMKLENLKKLTWLAIDDSPGVTRKGVLALKRKLPQKLNFQ